MLPLARWASRGIAGVSAVLLVSDFFSSDRVIGKGYPPVVVGIFITSGLVAGLTIDPPWKRVTRVILGGPKIVLDGVSEVWRQANASKGGAFDLQVVYAIVLNERDGGGERATFDNAEVLMEARDESDKVVATCKGNWLYLGSRRPYDYPQKAIDLKPTRERSGLEIAGKFAWWSDAWLAGEGDPPSLVPGVYTVRASIVNGKAKARTFEWSVKNPGEGKPLEVVGVDLVGFRKRVETRAPSSSPIVAAPLSEESSKTQALDELLADAGRLRQQSIDVASLNVWLAATRKLFDAIAPLWAYRIPERAPSEATVEVLTGSIDEVIKAARMAKADRQT